MTEEEIRKAAKEYRYQHLLVRDNMRLRQSEQLFLAEHDENVRLHTEVDRLREALNEVQSYFNWDREAWKNSWCQDGTRRIIAEEAVKKALNGGGE